MFTGIVEEIGEIVNIERGRASLKIYIKAKKILEDIHLGDSIAVNGVCLTVNSYSGDVFACDVMHETLDRSYMKNYRPRDKVNLERAMQLNGRFGGHIVSGHIDGLGIISKIVKDDNAVLIEIKSSDDIMKYIVKKGSIAIDGISLTVADVSEDGFCVSIIPHTLFETILYTKEVGDQVNLENDCIGKYVEKILNYGQKDKESNITMEFLLKNGF